MKEIPVSVGKTYAVTTAGSCTVTDADGRELCTAESGSQSYFTANGHAVTLSDDAATVTQVNFKQALAALGLLGGGDKLPPGYTPLEFLESTGTQYIDTEIVPTNLHGLMTETLTKTSARVACLGSRNSLSADTRVFCPDNRPGYTIGYGWGSWIDLDFTMPPKRRIYYLNYRNSRIATGSEKISHSLPELAFVPTQPMYLFSVNVGGQPNSNFIGCVWAAAISYEKNILRQYVPTLDPTGAPCMFDLVTRKPFYNAGSGDFLYPGKEEQATTYSLRNRMYAQLTEHGVRRLYRVPASYNGGKEEYAAEHGFKLLIETPQPEEGYWTPVWHDREDCLELEWVETEPPAEEELLTEA